MRIQEMRSGFEMLRKRRDAKSNDKILEMMSLFEPDLLAVVERIEREMPVPTFQAERSEEPCEMLHEVGQKEAEERLPASELEERFWAVVSFERVEISQLTYAQATEAMVDLATRGVTGLCLVTMDVASRVRP
jgi:hypothetical protein